MPIEYLKSVGNKPDETYEAVKHLKGVNEYAKYSNDVEFGQEAILIERGRNNGVYGGVGETIGEIEEICQESSRNNQRLRASGNDALRGLNNQNEQADGLFFDSKNKKRECFCSVVMFFFFWCHCNFRPFDHLVNLL